MARVGIVGVKYGRWIGRELAREQSLAAAVRKSGTDFSGLDAAILDAGIAASPYVKATSLQDIVPYVDAVAIATPVATHYELAKEALHAGKHVYLEKPLFWQPAKGRTEEQTAELFGEAARRGLILAGGSQFHAWIDYPFFQKPNLQSFGMTMRANNPKSVYDTLVDLSPHPLTVLRMMAGPGRLESAWFELNGEIGVHGTYARDTGKDVNFRFLFNSHAKEKELSFCVDGVSAKREDLPQPYTVYLRSSNGREQLEDPVKLSIQRFIACVNGNRYDPDMLMDCQKLFTDFMNQYLERQ